MARELGLADVEAIVGRVHYEKRFRVGHLSATGYYVQIEYEEPDIRTGELATQRGRKWYVSRHATDSEIVQTCLRAALDSAEHQVREHFGYRPAGAGPNEQALLVYGPHFSVDFLYDTMQTLRGLPGGIHDAREDPE